jgi:uncharacterized membrane protein
MYSKATFRGHPIHPMLIAFPITFYTLTVLSFSLYELAAASSGFWYRLGYFSTYAGLITAVVAALPGLIDWNAGIPRESAAKTRGLWHASLNTIALASFAVVGLMIRGTWRTFPDSVGGIVILSLIGWLVALAAAYQGWELVATHKVGVHMTAEQERLEPISSMDPRDHQSPLHPGHV